MCMSVCWCVGFGVLMCVNLYEKIVIDKIELCVLVCVCFLFVGV